MISSNNIPIKQWNLSCSDLKSKRFNCYFTSEQLARHLNYDCNKIVFISGWFIGKVGDHTSVGDYTIGESYDYVLTEQYSINMCHLSKYEYLYREVGFRTKRAFEDEIHRVNGYDPNKLLIIHTLELVRPVSKYLPLHVKLLHALLGYNYE